MGNSPKVSPLTPAMWAALESGADGHAIGSHLIGRDQSFHGGFNGTWTALHRRGLIDEAGRLTSAGQAVLGDYRFGKRRGS